MEWELWFSGGVFCWRGGHKPHGKVAGKGNALLLSRVNKGRDERCIFFFPCNQGRRGRCENKKIIK